MVRKLVWARNSVIPSITARKSGEKWRRNTERLKFTPGLK